MMDSSAGVSLEAMLVAMAAFSLISPPGSTEAAAVAVVVAFVEVEVAVVADALEEASAPLLNHEETCEKGLTDPPLAVVFTDAPDPCLL